MAKAAEAVTASVIEPVEVMSGAIGVRRGTGMTGMMVGGRGAAMVVVAATTGESTTAIEIGGEIVGVIVEEGGEDDGELDVVHSGAYCMQVKFSCSFNFTRRRLHCSHLRNKERQV